MEHVLRILMLEDSLTDAEIEQRILKKEFPQAILKLVMSKDAFMAALTDFVPDLILADNSLPQLSAAEALDIARIYIPHIPFIMVTGTVSEEFAAQIIKAGANDYILKDRLIRLPSAIIGALKTCSAEREKTDALQRQKEDEEKYRMLVERVSNGFMALNTQWDVVYINSVAEKMMEREPGTLLGKNLWKEFPELIGKGFYIAYYKAMRTQQNVYIIEYLLPYQLWVEANIYPSQTGVSIFFRDITEQKKVEELGLALVKEKELSELKSGFVTMASHEFRTPLTTILSSTHLIEMYTTTEEQPKRKKHLNRINSSVAMLIEILNDFLSLGKIEEGKIEVRPTLFDIAETTLSTIEEIKDNLKKEQTFNYRHTGETDVTLDASLLRHIIMNLVSNASKFSPERTTVEINSSAHDGHIMLSVKDQGIGISKEDQEHLMERFFRGSNAGNIQGTGLGLHIVSKYASLMNGTLRWNSEQGKGTEFIIEFDNVVPGLE